MPKISRFDKVTNAYDKQVAEYVVVDEPTDTPDDEEATTEEATSEEDSPEPVTPNTLTTPPNLNSSTESWQAFATEMGHLNAYTATRSELIDWWHG